MKKKLIGSLLFFGVFFVVIVGGIALYDLFVFRPCIEEAKKILQEAHMLHRNPPKFVLELVVFSEGETSIKTYTTRQLLNMRIKKREGMLRWHIKFSLSTFLLGIHFNSDEILTLWCQLVPYEEGEGLNESANFYFGRDLNLLKDIEIAQLITLLKCPSFYEKNKDKLNAKAIKLLEKFREIDRN